jgi:predicted RNA binding protein YcfA (HicA-like mRNA interferase family)
MSNVPSLSGSETIAVLCKDGFAVVRISGSHHILKKEGLPNTVSVPVHGSRALKRGTLRGIVRQAGLSMMRFVELLNE